MALVAFSTTTRVFFITGSRARNDVTQPRTSFLVVLLPSADVESKSSAKRFLNVAMSCVVWASQSRFSSAGTVSLTLPSSRLSEVDLDAGDEGSAAAV